MKVINPFIIDGPLNVSDIEMCEFVDHLEMSECFKKYKNSDHLLCNVPLHYLMTICLKIIEFHWLQAWHTYFQKNDQA